MDEADQIRFRELISDRLDDLASADLSGVQGQEIVTLDQQSIGRLSRQDALQMQAMAQANARRRTIETQRLNQALARLSAGEFGWCEECGDPIATARLELDPAATRCISCATG